MSPETEALLHRQMSEPSNAEIIGAFAPSDHLELFCVGNKSSDRLYVLAQSWQHAKIIAMMGGHIRSLQNAARWKPTISSDEKDATAQAIRDRIPGAIWIRRDHVLTREKVYYPAGKRTSAA